MCSTSTNRINKGRRHRGDFVQVSDGLEFKSPRRTRAPGSPGQLPWIPRQQRAQPPTCPAGCNRCRVPVHGAAQLRPAKQTGKHKAIENVNATGIFVPAQKHSHGTHSRCHHAVRDFREAEHGLELLLRVKVHVRVCQRLQLPAASKANAALNVNQPNDPPLSQSAYHLTSRRP